MQHKNAEYFKRMENFIDKFTAEYSVSPTSRQISEGTGLSPATVSRYLKVMREENVLDYGGVRNITTRRERQIRSKTYNFVPVLGAVSCGVPKLAEENVEEYVKLPASLFGKGDFFILRANGDSMIGAGIDDGDLALIRQQNTAEPGQIVAALMEDEATLKRFYPEPENHRVRLHPENPEMWDIYRDNVIIQGVAVKVIKDLA
jgi:repressor LexA